MNVESLVGEKPMTSTEVRFRLNEFERSPAMVKMREGIMDMINKVILKVISTPIQFKFPKSKRRRIRKKWSKNPDNFRTLMNEPFENIEIVV